MKTKTTLVTVMKWLPSLLLTLFYIPNALNKLLDPNQVGKVVENNAVMITAGVYLLAATALFLYPKTIPIGTVLLSLYMIFIVIVHMYKGKPSEVAILLIIATLFAAYLRKPLWFHQKQP